ncbi:MAG: hypothetical protein HUU29_13775 [Planctomycetaceae bacterium]|nr:hypothetical protein [Planctomycetaceae bacterium]
MKRREQGSNVRSDACGIIAPVLFAAIFACSISLVFNDQAWAESDGPKLFRDDSGDGADRPSGRLLLRMPQKVDDVSPQPVAVPTAEPSEPPAEPEEPVEERELPTFFGEPVSGRVVFIIDVSLSMNLWDVGAGEDYNGNIVAKRTRIHAVKFELWKMVQNLDDDVAFDIIWLAGNDYDAFPRTDAWKGQLVNATESIKEEAVEAIKRQVLWGGTPTWHALKRATHDYGNDLSKLVLLTDGEPFPRDAGDWGDSHDSAILNDFPGWFEPIAANGCELLCVQVGQNPGATAFMGQFAAATGSAYIHVQ